VWLAFIRAKARRLPAVLMHVCMYVCVDSDAGNAHGSWNTVETLQVQPAAKKVAGALYRELNQINTSHI
jgi:hypothetical protein